ncbi:hypothetical protein BY996DRAFT_6425244 [Phakopsora pachyrhizi]|nr:hypothetical protein BY996DRAFT_6425244 [Phakopsora pachyrhizi]
MAEIRADTRDMKKVLSVGQDSYSAFMAESFTSDVHQLQIVLFMRQNPQKNFEKVIPIDDNERGAEAEYVYYFTSGESDFSFERPNDTSLVVTDAEETEVEAESPDTKPIKGIENEILDEQPALLDEESVVKADSASRAFEGAKNIGHEKHEPHESHYHAEPISVATDEYLIEKIPAEIYKAQLKIEKEELYYENLAEMKTENSPAGPDVAKSHAFVLEKAVQTLEQPTPPQEEVEPNPDDT